MKLHKGIGFLGFRIFFNHKLIRRKNLRKFDNKFRKLRKLYKKGLVEREKVVEKFEGWLAYVSHANTYKYKKHLVRLFNQYFPLEPDLKVINLTKHENFQEKVKSSTIQFSRQKTLQLLKKGLSVKKIAEKRNLKESTIWEHLAGLIEHHQCSIRSILPKEKIDKIIQNIHSENDKLRNIKIRIDGGSITYDEINCVLASVKCSNEKKSICYLIKWYQRTNCYRKCYLNKRQRKECKMKFDYFASRNPTIEMKKKEFLDFFNENMKICILPEKEKRAYLSWRKFQLIKSKLMKKSPSFRTK